MENPALLVNYGMEISAFRVISLLKLDTPHCSRKSNRDRQIEAAGTRTSVLQKLTQRLFYMILN